jgi:hypothetical protein
MENVMKAIAVKYISASNLRGSRIKAFDSDKHSVTISYSHELSGDNVYAKAAIALCKKMGWTGRLVSGGVKIAGSSYEVFCFVESHGMEQSIFEA